MIISILSCDISKPTGKNYEQAEIAFKNEAGEIKGKKVFSFTNKGVWDNVRNFKSGDKYVVTSVKNDKGFWEWTEIKPYVEGEQPAVQTQSYSKGTPAPVGHKGTDFRSSEEIIRTTALEVASEICIANKGAKETVAVANVIEMAKLFVTYIRKGEFDPFPEAVGTFDDLDEDIPQ